MTKSMRAFGSIAVVLALAVPATAWAQAGPRTSSGSSSSSGSAGGSSGSSGGNSGGGGSEGTRAAPPSGANGAPMGDSTGRTTPSRVNNNTSSASRTARSSETPRVAPAPGGVAGAEVTASTVRSTGSAASRFGATDSSFVDSANSARSRGDGGIRGIAGARPLPVYPPGDYVSFPFYGPWGGWYPWCYSGFGWGLGFVYYDPWFYGPTSWYWGRYGMWYDPYAYFGDPYVSSGAASSSSSEKLTFGSVRIKANVSEAKVYVDGALAGLVDEFDGLKDHLELATGKHTIELRAEGYTTASAEVEISKGKTKTVRLDLKKGGSENK